MQITKHDKIIGQAHGGAVLQVAKERDKSASDGDDKPRLKKRRTDRYQMTWYQLCKSVGINYETWWTRVTKYRWNPVDAFKVPIEPHAHIVMSIKDLCARVGVHPGTYSSRRTAGWTARQALGVDPRPDAPRTARKGHRSDVRT